MDLEMLNFETVTLPLLLFFLYKTYKHKYTVYTHNSKDKTQTSVCEGGGYLLEGWGGGTSYPPNVPSPYLMLLLNYTRCSRCSHGHKTTPHP